MTEPIGTTRLLCPFCPRSIGGADCFCPPQPMNRFPPPMHLRTPIPIETRQQVMCRANRCCEDCGDGVRLELHHLRYWTEPPFSEPIFGYETDDDLAALCRDCHHARHIDPNGEFWVDPEAMEEHWFFYHHDEMHAGV